jgi:hypothetical protein
MISHSRDLDRKIKGSNLEEIYERLCMSKIDQIFAEIFSEFGKELATNKIFEPYIINIANKENEYRQQPNFASILQNATYTPADQQALDQEMLRRKERISEYFSVWSIMRFYELYDISIHERVRTELIAKNDLTDLADFEKGIIVLSDILEGYSNANLADYYLPHAHRVMSGIIQFFDKKNCLQVNYNTNPLDHPGIITRLKLKREEFVLIVDEKKLPIDTPLKLRYISLFFKKDGSPNKKKIYDDEIHSKVFGSDAVTRDSEFKKKEKDQVAGQKRYFKDIIQVKNRRHSIKQKYLN